MERKMPEALWISIASLAAITLIQLVVGVREGSGSLLLAVVGNVALLVGLLRGHKWAYVATLFFAIGGPIVALGSNARNAIAVLIGNGLVVVPMLMSTEFFFPGQSETLNAGPPGTDRA